MIRGWLSQLDRSKFQVFGYHTGDRPRRSDRDRRQPVRSLCPGTVARRPLARRNPRRPPAHPDLSRYRHGSRSRPGSPRTGWRRSNALPGATRIRPATRRSTISCRATLMEPPDAEQHYTERLVRLPNLSIYYEPLDLSLPQISREQLGLRPSSVAYWCGQSLFKYLPQYDQVFARIARAGRRLPVCFHPIASWRRDDRAVAPAARPRLRRLRPRRRASTASSCRVSAWSNSSPPSANATSCSTASAGRAATRPSKASRTTRRS